jgi:hypothetical protein
MAKRASACNRKDLKVKGGQRTVKYPVETAMADGVEEWGERSAGFKSTLGQVILEIGDRASL